MLEILYLARKVDEIQNVFKCEIPGILSLNKAI